MTINFCLMRRYIEGLQNQSRYVTNWDKSLRANMENSSMVTDVNRLPTHWLSSSSLSSSQGDHQNPDVVSALWILRDHMMKDALSLSKAFH